MEVKDVLLYKYQITVYETLRAHSSLFIDGEKLLNHKTKGFDNGSIITNTKEGVAIAN